ncbi:uncharacterized protein B0H64DRAFT_99576 [Chaetomium fimeti]|uniref:Uncharacterized protein n=1 Tax=Chaetomium fimeti TaxID=1854472 RepID=A0AAE0HMQ8_9PEZI|nr:hypothetical protein B0H64DRAFT_99576 [Chaetomium fimeti]
MSMEKQEPSLEADEQSGSLLFQRVPQEIRNHIYAQLFSSIRLTFGFRWNGCTSRVAVKPAPHGFAFLHSCRRARLEINDSWLQYMLFSFEDPYEMLDHLSALPTEMLSKIRRVRVSGDQLAYTIFGEQELYPLAGALKLLPGLQLDQLTVVGLPEGRDSYNTLNGLIKGSGGWKTLRFVSPNSSMLGFEASRKVPFTDDTVVNDWEDWRESQPENWQAMLEARDGRDSHPSVTVYRAREPSHRSSRPIPRPSECVEYRQEPVQQLPGWNPDFVPEDPDLMGEGEKDKALLVVVKRGAGVDYQEKEDSPFVNGDLREHEHGSTWEEIGGPSLWANGGRVRDRQPPIVDDYNDPEEHVWTQRHFCKGLYGVHYDCHRDEC